MKLIPSAFGEASGGRALGARQQQFVNELLANGGKLKAAAVAAGYSPKGAAQTASHLARNPLVQRAIAEAIGAGIGASAVGALRTVTRLSLNAQSEYVRLEASRDLLDRAGFAPIDRHAHAVDATLTVSIDIGAPSAVVENKQAE